MHAATPFTKPVAELEQLTAGLEALAHAGRIAPCIGAAEWISESEADRIAAAEGCTWCPMASPCLAAGLASRATFGVYGGTDLGDPTARKAAQRAARRAARTTQ